ncbi:MAG: TonB-dependent receptor [Proteobacteria bacterium]|nr:TonB-dependent receptor [Pseudomonadota bacterium]
MSFKTMPLACALALAAWNARAADAASSSAPAASAAGTTQQLEAVQISGKREKLDAARNSLSPETGSSIYRFDSSDLQKLPLGDATPLNQVLLRAPGVVQDSFAAGQLHVRGDHANLQYRINGIVIPESVSGFSGALDTQFANQISLLTGALPAQYGYRTAGVVDIHTKGADSGSHGSLDVTAGSNGHAETSLDVGGSAGDFSYFVTGSFLRSDLGIENPTPARDAIHDDTRQTKGFAYLSYLLGNSSRVSLMLGSSDNHFQIPDVPGESPAYAIADTTIPPSSALDADQYERSNFQVLSFESSLSDKVDYQIAAFRRYSDVHYEPDPVGDLAYTGVASNTVRRNEAYGLQADLSARIDARHTVRAGLYLQRERGAADNTSAVFPADADGNQTSTVPLSITDNARLGGHLYGVYVQDEWQPTKALTVDYGLRYDQVSTVVHESQWSPRLGLVYQVGETTRLHAGYARYFTPPPTEKIDTTSVAAFAGTTNALPSDANTSVRSERSNYYDAGISQELGKHVTLGADAYYREVRHLQDEGQFGSAFIYSAFNYERGKIYGLELSASYKDERLSGYANAAFSSARAQGIESGQFNFDPTELAYIASNWVHVDHDETVSASAGASYRLADGTTVSGDALYGSGLRNGFANTDHLPAHVTLNASASHGFDFAGFGHIDVRLSVINLLDRVYELRDGSGIGVGAPQFGQRRAFYVSVSKPFGQ